MTSNERYQLEKLRDNLQDAINMQGHITDKQIANLPSDVYALYSLLATTAQDTVKMIDVLLGRRGD